MKESTNIAGWVRSAGWAAAVMAGILVVAVLGNIAVGRMIHWDIVTGLGLAGLAGLTLIHRYG